MKTILFLILIFAFQSLAVAEYRAFNLKITDTLTNQERFVKSNLDPIQYQGYYQLKPTEIITYTDSWMCKGRTNDQAQICNNPANPLPPATNAETERLPASDKTSLAPQNQTPP